MKIRIRWVFITILITMLATPLAFVQSRYFAKWLTKFAKENILKDVGVEGGFQELSVQIFPPGLLVQEPKVVLKESNPIGLPLGTKLEAKHIEVTFDMVQLITGIVSINGVVIHGANLNVQFTREFFELLEKRQHEQKKKFFQRKKQEGLTFDQIIAFKFRSIGFTESNLDLSFNTTGLPKDDIKFVTYAKELTIGKGFSDSGQSIDLGLDLASSIIQGQGMLVNLTQAHASFGLTEAGIEIRNFAIQDETRNIHLDGMVKGNVFSPKNLQSDVNYFLRGPIESWINDAVFTKLLGSKKKISGHGLLKLSGKARADLLNLKSTIEVSSKILLEEAEIENYGFKTLEMSMDYGNGSVKLNQFQIVYSDDGKINIQPTTFNGQALLAGDAFSSDIPIGVLFEAADLHKILGPQHVMVFPLKLQLNGSVAGNLKLSKKSKQSKVNFEVKTTNDLTIRNFILDNQNAKIKKPLHVVLSAEEVKFKSETVINEDGVFLSSGAVKLNESEFKSYGSVTGENGFDLDMTGNVNLKDLKKLAAFEIEGVGPLHWTVKSKGKSVIFGFDAELENARYLDLHLGKTAGRVLFDDETGVLTFENLKTTQGKLQCVANGTINLSDTDKVDIDIDIPSGTIQDFAKVFSTFINRSITWYPYELTGQLSGKLKVSGKTDMNALSVLGDLNMANVDYHYEIFREGRMRAGFVAGDYIAENFEIQKKNGWFRGNFKYDKEGVITYDVRSEGLSTLDIDRLGLLDIPYRAGITFNSKGSGKINALKSSTYLQVGSGNVKNYFIPNSELILSTENNRVKAKASVFNQKAVANLDYGWADGASSNLDLEAHSLDFLPALVVVNPNILDEPKIESSFTGKAKFSFKTGDFAQLTGLVDVRELVLNRLENSFSLADPLRFEIKDGDYRFDRMRITGDATSIVWSGKAERGILNHDIGGEVSLKTLELLVPEFQKFDGVAQFQSTLRGNTDKVKFKSEINVKNAEAKVRSLVQPFENMNIKVLMDDDIVNFTEMSTRFASGKITGSGKAELYSTKVPDLDFQFVFNNTKIQTYPVVFARVNGKLTLTGKELPYLAKGSFSVAEALIRENFQNNENSKLLRTTKYMPQGKAIGSSDFQLFEMDIDLYADQGIFVRNDLFDGELKGKLKLLKTTKSPGVLGNISVISGRLLFKDSYFAIQSGSFRFNNPAVIDPEFEVTGQTDYKGYKIYIASNGKTSDYKINFQSQPQLSQNDIVNLLTLGVTSSGAESLSGLDREAYTRDEMVGLIFNQSSFNKGLQEKLGVKLKLSQSQSTTPDSLFRSYPNDSSTTISPKVVVQKQVTKSLNASAGSTVGVGENKEQSFDLEYNVGRNWSVLGIYEDQRGAQPQNSRTSVGADLKFKLRFK